MNATGKYTLEVIGLLVAIALSRGVHAHGGDSRIVQPLQWGDGQIVASGATRKISIAGKECLVGEALYFNVRDEHAFDIDETVWLDIEIHADSAGSRLGVSYDRNGAAAPNNVALLGDRKYDRYHKVLQVPPANGGEGAWYKQSIPLERARFANLVLSDIDFALFGLDFFSKKSAQGSQPFTLCGLALRRSYETPLRNVVGRVSIEVVNESGEPTPARMGIYDSSKRLPLPNDEAVSLRNPTKSTRVIALGPGAAPWPSENRSVFYTDGRYQARLPVGAYDLIVAKGPEYRLARQRFVIEANRTKRVQIKLRRWIDMAARGWYSGEDHIHYLRDSEHDDQNLQLFARAEDLRVANILQMGDIANIYYRHHDWKPVAAKSSAPFLLVPGQEDPRTFHIGHTIQLNTKEFVRDSTRYLLYDKIFEAVRAQGGMSGYAHVIDGGAGLLHTTVRGLAIDVPFGLVDFVEIMSLQHVGTSLWFDFLNLGYKLSPTAGTDYPWGGVPGTVRNYVRIDKQLTQQGWFDGLKRGRTFVTSGPMLDITINGRGMGEEIRVKNGESLLINAQASINPDIDALSSLELIEQGQVVKKISLSGGAEQMSLRHEVVAGRGTWFVLRARGKNPDVVALSAPIYVLVDGRSFWNASQVPLIVEKMRSMMQGILRPNALETPEEWDAREPLARHWDGNQLKLLENRIAQANALYESLLQAAASDRARDHP